MLVWASLSPGCLNGWRDKPALGFSWVAPEMQDRGAGGQVDIVKEGRETFAGAQLFVWRQGRGVGPASAPPHRQTTASSAAVLRLAKN